MKMNLFGRVSLIEGEKIYISENGEIFIFYIQCVVINIKG